MINHKTFNPFKQLLFIVGVCLLSVSSVSHAGFNWPFQWRLPLVDNQPRFNHTCPIDNMAHTQDERNQVRQYNCTVDGVNVVWSLSIPRACSDGGCGLIVDVHGAAMNAQTQNNGTRLRAYGADAMRFGASTPYIVVQPNFTDLFDDVNNQIDVLSFMGSAYTNELSNMDEVIDQIIDVFSVDTQRIHMYGFSRGASTVSAHYCDADKNAKYASMAGSGGAIGCNPQPNKPFMLINGKFDPLKMPLNDTAENFIRNASFQSSETVMHSDDNWQQPRLSFAWTGIQFTGQHRHVRLTADEYVLESVRHSARGYPTAGHCHPALGTSRWLVCRANFDTGRKLIDFFIAHPKQD